MASYIKKADRGPGPHADEYEYRSFSLEGSDELLTKGFLRAKAESSP